MARSPRKKPDATPEVAELLRNLAAREDEFLHGTFLAPGLRQGSVRVRIAGAICRMRIAPADFQGWGVFQPASHMEARLVRTATLAERRRYLDLFPMIRLFVCRRAGNAWYGSAASFGDSRIQLDGLAPIQLAEEVQLFDCVRSRYDGSQFWFDELDMRHDPAASAYLRTALRDGVEPAQLTRRGLTSEERACYELNHWERVRPPDAPQNSQHEPRRVGRRRHAQPSEPLELEQDSDPVLGRLRDSLSHAGAQLLDYLERADSFRVRFQVGHREFTSSVDKDDLTIQVAGICLSGEDQKFDLASLVGVLRQAENGGEIVPVGDDNRGIDEEVYWRAHPRRR